MGLLRGIRIQYKYEEQARLQLLSNAVSGTTASPAARGTAIRDKIAL